MFLISSTGHGLREIEDEWDFPRVDRWLEYCSNNPPLRVMVAAYLGVGDDDKNGDGKTKPFRVTTENFGEFMRMIKADGGAG